MFISRRRVGRVARRKEVGGAWCFLSVGLQRYIHGWAGEGI
jgi:hypothetical protein